MGRSFKVPVAPAVLVWARKTARLRVDEAAKAADVDDAVIKAWEGGTQQPTLPQLRKLGEKYKRPLAVLLLAEPPQDWQALHDYRSLENADEQTPALAFAIRLAHERRLIALEMLEVLGEKAGSFAVRAKLQDDPEEVGKSIRAALKISVTDQLQFESTSAALGRWRAAAEGQGVLVFGFPGVKVSEARGFSFSEFPLPAIALNSSDAPAARVFTLMHELAHIALRSGGVLCDLRGSNSQARRIEVFCNHVAGAVLVPAPQLLADSMVRRADEASTWSEADVARLGNQFRVSREVIVRRLLVLGRTNAKHYAWWRKLFEAEAQRYREKMAENQGGPPPAVLAVSRLGRLLPRLVLTAHDRDSITTSAASGYLGIKTQWFRKLAQEVAGPNEATL